MNKFEVTTPKISQANIIVGVSGSIAAYKSANLVSLLTKAGATVNVVLSSSAQKFIGETTFRALTKGYVLTDLFNHSKNGDNNIPHVQLAQKADLVVIAPTSASRIAKFSCGIADDLLGLIVLGTKAPILLVPAMEENMWTNSANQRNCQILQRDGMHIIGPDIGHHASGFNGLGRMVEPASILGHIQKFLGKSSDLSGHKITVTAGGTREPLDPVRVISNRSSGKMGIAIARAARDRGGEVSLITTTPPPIETIGINVTIVESAAQMKNSVINHLAQTDILVMAAAVADYRPKTVLENKIKKMTTGKDYSLVLERTDDILAMVAKKRLQNSLHDHSPKVVIGFAAETENLVQAARQKLKEKNLDLIVANLIKSNESTVFGTEYNEVIIINRKFEEIKTSLLSKDQISHYILDQIKNLLI